MKKISYTFISLSTITILSSCSGEQSTSEKMDNYLNRYQSAENLIFERNYKENDPISRTGLEYYLGDLFFDKFSEDELTEIANTHKEIVNRNAESARKNSVINLDDLRNQEEGLIQFCSNIPKGGMLHVHPWGLFTKSVVRKILTEYDPIIDPVELINHIKNKTPKQFLYENEYAILENLPSQAHFMSYTDAQKNQFIDLFVLPHTPETHDFQRFDSIFSFIYILLGKDDVDDKLLLAYSEFLKNARANNVSYVEFTEYFSPKVESIEKLKKWADYFYEETGIIVKWNIAFLRFNSGEENAEYMKKWNDLLVEHPSDEITGVDLLSIERGYPALDRAQNMYGYLDGFNREHKNHPLEMTMHAGEMGEPRNVRDAMLMGVSRIGHGVLLQNDPVTLEYARRKALPIEINLTSNYRLGVHDMYASPHPFLYFLRLGLPVSLSTDNDAIFETSIANECVAAVKTTNIEYSELKQMSYNSLTTSFADKETKDMLLQKLDGQFQTFEQNFADRQ